MFEVPAGGRRFRALELAGCDQRMAKDQPVPCVVGEGGIAEEDSLAENVKRVALHPLDQFRAFKSLREAGLGEEEIAARFFVTPSVVRQRLRLASVSDKLLDLYAEDALTLDQLMAFTVSCDHGRQEQVWEAVSQGYNPQAYTIRRMLTEDSVRADDRRVRFVGRAAYEEAGGAVVRDLFQADDGGWLTDVPLLERLVGEKLNDEAVQIADEGWKWVEAALDLPYGHEFGMRRITGTSPELGKKDQAKLDRLLAEFDRLSEEHEDADELPDAVDARFGELETAIAALQNQPKVYDPIELTRAGVFITVASGGRLLVERGFVRAEDEAPVEAGPDDQQQGGGTPVVTVDGKSVEPQDEEDDVIRPLPERLVAELTAERTLALRDALAQSPDAAFTALVHALARSAFCPTSGRRNRAWASEMTSLTPGRPWRVSVLKNVVHKASASDAPMSMPRTSHFPSLLTPTAIMTANETMRPFCRTLTPAFAGAGFGRVDPQIAQATIVPGALSQAKPAAFDGAVQEGMDTLIDLLAQTRYLALGDAAHSHRADKIIDRAGRYAL